MTGSCRFKGKLLDLSLTLDGDQRLTIQLDGDFRQAFDDLKDAEIDLTVAKHRKKRSLDANGYAWVLIDQIAAKKRISKTEVYRNAIREIGGVSDTVCAENRTVKRLTEQWCKKGLGWQAETMPSKLKGCTNVILYYGSSSYDTAQMSALIDSLVQDAQAIGIDTRSPKEIQALLDEYGCVDGVR